MRGFTLILLIFWTNYNFISASNYKALSYKSDFYEVLASSDTLKINKQIRLLSTYTISEKKAFTGTLMMKKAGFIKPLGQKMKFFNEGKSKLEQAIKDEPQNAEYRFLRLVIQENCPPVLKYSHNISEDLKKVTVAYAQFTPELKAAVLKYSKTSKNLKEEDL